MALKVLAPVQSVAPAKLDVPTKHLDVDPGKALSHGGWLAPKVVAKTTEVVEHEQQPEPKVQVLVSTEADALVIELLDLERRLQLGEVDKMLKRKEELRKQILAEHADASPDTVIKLEAPGGVVEFSKPSQEYQLTDKWKLQAEVGPDTFMELAKFGITDLKKVLSENMLAKLGQYKTGTTRSMKIKLSPA